ncbi:MBL fold metallo-hydrolase [Pseudonocardia asaccharolytica]|uniref:MBL fold hydrolase n=1 Tax=Pseudonocardia asaccharolytica DSM 44247 = NBRC 16224 TaxID=1123024 RepID=A0A511CYM4_9PSEU|nr:MBL fold metallo-hydrolase [Pseudonocardia asaccharolytica]GEL17363.1 MBL fold hydrolase [Pseudonocardia asaccharolytica DSM 44247 = NBRC 16224]
MDGGRLVFKQYYLGCLSQASYLIGDRGTGRAVVVDPQRDVGEYLADAKAEGLRIERVLETHVHADFLSGHLELAAATGARIGYGSAAQVEFEIDLLEDGEKISLGEVELEIMHTPGHTPESICILVREKAGDATPYAVLTGDTLFIGDVGRPDLLGARGWSKEDLAKALYRSTREKLLTLPDETRVYPAHGAGSACGKNLSTETSSTIGDQRRSNYALAPMSEADFVDAVCEGQTTAPMYFAFASVRNREARPTLDETAPVPAMTVAEVREARDAGAAVLDTRDPQEFATGHLPGSVNVNLGGRFAEQSGQVLAADQDIVLVTEPGTEVEARNRLARIGFDRVVGHLEGGPAALGADAQPSSRLTAEQLAGVLDGVQVVDVRGPGEIRAGGTVPHALQVPLPALVGRLGEIDPARPTVVICASGMRSSVAASLMRTRGFADVSDLLGGFTAWNDGNRPVAVVEPA